MPSFAANPVIRNQKAPNRRQHYTSPEPKTVLNDYPTVVDLKFGLNLSTPFYPSNPRKAWQWQAQQNKEDEEDATKPFFVLHVLFDFLIDVTKNLTS